MPKKNFISNNLKPGIEARNRFAVKIWLIASIGHSLTRKQGSSETSEEVGKKTIVGQ